MKKKILIDLQKFRGDPERPADHPPAEGFVPALLEGEGLKGIRELAAFRFACRRCTDAPCMAVCPSDALEKDGDGMIRRSVNLCVSCKSCVIICPFGTLMTDFFSHHIHKEHCFNLMDDHELESFITHAPEGAVEWVEMEEDPKQDIYSLHERILVREKTWKTDT